MVCTFGGLWNTKHLADIQNQNVLMLFFHLKAHLDCVHTMPAHFENGEQFDG